MVTHIVGKTPVLEAYHQTRKSLYGLITWYKTEKMVNESALRVALTSATTSNIIKEWEAKVDIRKEILLYRPTKITITGITVESKWSGSGTLTSDVDVNVLNSARDKIAEFKNVGSDHDAYKLNHSALSLDVTGQNLFILQVYQFVQTAPGGNDVRTRHATIEFTFETDVTVSEFKLRCVDEDGLLMSGVHASISGMSFELPTGEDIISLPNGNYSIVATAFIGKEKYIGKLDFSVPATVVTVILKWVAPPLAWYVIPLVVSGLAFGGVVTVGSVVGRRRPTPSVVIMREK